MDQNIINHVQTEPSKLSKNGAGWLRLYKPFLFFMGVIFLAIGLMVSRFFIIGNNAIATNDSFLTAVLLPMAATLLPIFMGASLFLQANYYDKYLSSGSGPDLDRGLKKDFHFIVILSVFLLMILILNILAAIYVYSAIRNLPSFSNG